MISLVGGRATLSGQTDMNISFRANGPEVYVKEGPSGEDPPGRRQNKTWLEALARRGHNQHQQFYSLIFLTSVFNSQFLKLKYLD